MGLVIREFAAAQDRNRVRLQEQFEVEIECGWAPFDEGGTEHVTLGCEQRDFAVAPRTVDVAVDADGGVTTKRFRLSITGPRDEMVDIVATSQTGSTDSFLIRVVR